MLKIYKASAGSGKTYTLALEFIRELIGIRDPMTGKPVLNIPKYTASKKSLSSLKDRHRYILAITFTNKATEEMKRRIIDELQALSTIPAKGQKDANYAQTLRKYYHCSRADIAEASAKALREILYRYGDFNVTTIDSFFQRVLRTFARELDQQGDFAVEINDYQAVQNAVDTMIDDFNSAPTQYPRLGKWIYDYIVQRITSGDKSNFFNRNSQLHNRIVGLVSNICRETFKPYESDMMAYLDDPSKISKLRSQIKAIETNTLKDVSQRVMQYRSELAQRGADPDQINGQKSVLIKLIGNFANSQVPDKKDLQNEAMLKVLNDRVDPFKGKSKTREADIKSFVEMLSYCRKQHLNLLQLKDIDESLDMLELLSMAWRYLSDFIAANNTILLSDTNHLLSKIIGEDETPFIYERMGVQFRNFLIDEFQDTSRMQWQNLRPLVANGLSFPYNDSLIIGDEKQSIYRFRNSDSSLLQCQVADDYANEAFEIKEVGRAPGENTNYRSARDIVRFNNTLFHTLATTAKIDGYEHVVQEICDNRKDQPSYIEFVPMASDADESNNTTKDDDDDNDNYGDKQLSTMMANIRRQHDQGGYAWSDIAILVQKNKQAKTVIDYLTSNGPDIPVMSDEALLVSRSPVVQLIVGVLKVLNGLRRTAKIEDEETDTETETETTTGTNTDTYTGELKPTNIEVNIAISRFGYFYRSGLSVEQAAEAALNEALATRDESMVSYIDKINKFNPSTLPAMVETILHTLTTEDERSSQISFINAFQDYLLDFCSRNTPSLQSFIGNWESVKNKLSVSSALGVDAVNVMTIHKSKGLEFDCVHIPYGSWLEAGKPRGDWYPMPHIDDLDPELCPPAIFLTLDPKLADWAGSYFHEVYKDDEYARKVDTMNLTYVAYTRAGSELMVYYDHKKNMGKRLDEAFSTTCDEADDRLIDISKSYDAKTGSLIIGEHTHKRKTDNSDQEAVTHIDTYDVYLHSGTEMLTRVTDILEAEEKDPSKDTDPDKRAYEADPAARRRGVALHSMLSLITTASDIPEAVKQVHLSQRLPSADTAWARKMLDEMLDNDDERIKRWFVGNGQTFTEQPIYVPKDEDDDYRRPDRIVVYDDGTAEVIDYKFTKKVTEPHKDQVREYVGLLREMGYTQVRGYLWYPLKRKNYIIEV